MQTPQKPHKTRIASNVQSATTPGRATSYPSEGERTARHEPKVTYGPAIYCPAMRPHDEDDDDSDNDDNTRRATPQDGLPVMPPNKNKNNTFARMPAVPDEARAAHIRYSSRRKCLERLYMNLEHSKVLTFPPRVVPGTMVCIYSSHGVPRNAKPN